MIDLNLRIWLREKDSNLRLLGYEPSGLTTDVPRDRVIYSQAPRDAQFMRTPLRAQKPMAVILGSVPGRLDPHSD